MLVSSMSLRKISMFYVLKENVSFLRKCVAFILFPIILLSSSAFTYAQDQTDIFIRNLWKNARTLGVSKKNFDEALYGFSPDAKIIAHTKKQSEFERPIWDYLDGILSKQKIQKGIKLNREWSKTLTQIEKKYQIPRSVLLGIWGMESNYGAYTGKNRTIYALASLAYVRYRGDFFRQQLLEALLMVEKDNLDPTMMVGSWAGAMGQTQFMPSSYRKYAVDYDRDGIKNIWSSVPDSLASIANYMREHGWNSKLPWGFEVQLPKKFSFNNYHHDFSTWKKLGLTRADGKAMPVKGEARLLAPAGARGPVFLVTENFDVIKAYNSSESYALGVALLGDCLVGYSPVAASWPRKEIRPDYNERIEIQRHLQRLGFYNEKVDGKFGSKTRESVRNFQMRYRLVADGYADKSLLEQLRKIK